MMLQFPAPGTPQRERIMVKSRPHPEDLAHHSIRLPPRPARRSAEPTLAEIIWCVASVTGVPILWMKSPRRARFLVHARFLFYRVAMDETTASLVKIARFCGDRDHSTVVNGLHRVRDNMPEFEGWIADVKALLEAGRVQDL